MVAARSYTDPILQPPLLLFDQTALELERYVRRLHYDDALLFKQWRLEFIYLETGFPHYRLYRKGRLVGAVQVRSWNSLSHIQKVMAIYLAHFGWTARNYQVQFWEAGKITPDDAPTIGLPSLIPNAALRIC